MENVWKTNSLKRLYLVLLSFFTFSVLQAQDINSAKVAPGLLEAMAQQPEAYHSVYIMLREQVNLDELEMELQKNKASVEERGYRVVTSLQEKAAATQPALLRTLKAVPGLKAESIHAFWVTNAIFFEALPSAISALSWNEDIARIAPNEKIIILDENQEAAPAPMLLGSSEPGLEAIGATQMWRMGYTGYGRKALIIDTGVDEEHPALHNQFAYHNQSLSSSWASPGDPQYCSDHGTHVAGITVGLDRVLEDTIGLAFDAQWLGGPVRLSECTFESSVLGTVATLQWALDPDGNPNTSVDRPDVVNNSWGGTEPGIGECTLSANGNAAIALHTAGIAVVWAAGNAGPGVQTINSPAMINNNLVRIFSVGNVNANTSNFPIEASSSRGPSICGGTGSLLIKPEVSAPGTNIRSAVPGERYQSQTGTSMSAPHVAGAVLLLKEAFPYLPGDDILLALYHSATDLGPAGEDNTYGKGMINIPAAYQYLMDEGHQPVPPASRDRDAILLDVATRDFNCSESMSATVTVENNSPSPITSLDFSQALGGPSSQFRWEGNIPVNGRETIALPALSRPEGEYTYRVFISKVNGQDDARPLNNQLKQDVRLLANEPLTATVVGNLPACSGGQALLRSDFEGEASIRWYTAAVGGELIGDGKELLLPVESSIDRTVYMEVSPQARVGREELPETGQRLDVLQEGLEFDVFAECTLKSVKMYAEEAGNRLVTLTTPEGSPITKILSLEAGENRVPLNISLRPGDGYEITLKGGKPLFFNLGIQNYPYEVENVISITGATAGSINYFYFYDWEIEYPYFCGRSPVEVNVAETSGPSEISFEPGNTEIDLASGLNEVAFTGPSAGISQWAWSFGDGGTSNVQNPVHAYTDTGTYRVLLTVITDAGCTSSAEGTVVVTESDVVSVKNVESSLGFNVFPNPAKGLLYLSFTLPQPIEADIFLMDMLGRQMLHRRTEIVEGQAVELSVSQLPEGIYWVTLVPRSYGSQGKKLVKKLIIAR